RAGGSTSRGSGTRSAGTGRPVRSCAARTAGTSSASSHCESVPPSDDCATGLRSAEGRMTKKRLAQAGLIALMALGGLMLWLGNPVIWLWIGSHTTGSQQGRMGPYLLVAFGILVSTVIVAFALARLNRAYQSL